ncbi:MULTISPECIES: hypothetical protein [unclassified Chryseobacterium]|uniref:hypothetical protein n=1 Tax=unclassified Chryseobacterium TaxID=2593645 RepID=UPI00100A6AA2|nr:MULTISPECIES: hypothetical protein [unclassified Chryseobacterium]RXM51632.1 hypothetical protein BOQ64_11940 [Chryseobacterium sp. CH25]RXM67208.1 hypothetical protein BOQ60_04660 [Chryseobacterium sp. CH1]
MPDTGIHIRTYKAVITMLILVFSLSPCPVKRDVLDIFDIQYISGLNKVKTTSGLSTNCDISSTSSKISISKTDAKIKQKKSFLDFNVGSRSAEEENPFLNEYSGHTTGNSPPKYILFKRLKLNLV